MKKYIINILLFFAIVVVIDLCVGLLGDYLQTHAKGGDTRKTNDLVQLDQHDILVFGSSRANHHYDTPFLSDTLGLDVYNAGYDGNGVVLSYGLLSIILERYQPKLIIIDDEPCFDINVYAGDNGNKRYIAPLKPYYHNEYVANLIKGVSKEEYYKSFSGMIRYNTTIISKAMDYIIGRPVKNQGYVPMSGVYSGDPEAKEAKTPPVDNFKLSCFEKMLALAKAKEVPVIIVASPKYGELNSKDLQPVIDLCEKYKVPFIDYYAEEEFMRHKEWFNEPMHLNAYGARVFSLKLLDDINQYINN